MNLEGLTEKRNHVGSIYFENSDGVMLQKVCAKCQTTKPLEDYHNNKMGLGGKQSTCKICALEYNKRYRDANKERIAKYYVKNKERILENQRKYQENNRERILEYQREWYTKNKERHAETGRMWRDNNKERCFEYYREYRLSNKERLNEKNRRLYKSDKRREWHHQYYKENKERYTEWRRNWTHNNRDKMALKDQRRRARRKSLPNTLSNEQYAITLSHFGNGCALTGCTENTEIEHALPLSIGHGGTTFENCYPLTATLNYSKSDSNIFEWFEANRQRFELSQDRFDNLIEYLASANAMTIKEYRDYVYWCHANPRNLNELEAN